MTFAIRVRVDASGSEGDRAGNSERGGNQRFREFWAEISGCERDHQGSPRTPIALCRTGERGASGGIGGSARGKGGKRKTPRGIALGVCR